MADLHPVSTLFDELEFLRFSEAQFGEEDINVPHIVGPGENKCGDFDTVSLSQQSSSQDCNKLLELRQAVASCTMSIYNSPETDIDINAIESIDDGADLDSSLCLEEQTLNALVSDSTVETFGSNEDSSPQFSISEPGDVTSMLPFSALPVTGRSPSPEADGDSSTSSQTAGGSMGKANDRSQGLPNLRPRRLKVAYTPARFYTPASQNDVRDSTVSSSQQQSQKTRKISDDDEQDKYFKSSKKMKRYLEGPSRNPSMERSRRNAINAKINRDRKKQEMVELQEQCERLQAENVELKNSNQQLEQRLSSAEEQLSFLRSIIVARLGVPDLVKQVKIGGHASAAGG